MKNTKSKRGRCSKKRTHHMCRISGHNLPQSLIGIRDAAQLLGTSIESINRGLIAGTVWGYKIEDGGMMELAYDRECARCGKVIMNLQCTVYCDTCRKENAEYGEKLAEGRKNRYGATGERKAKHKVPYKDKSPLAKMAWDARQAGMTYGQYMTKLTARWF